MENTLSQGGPTVYLWELIPPPTPPVKSMPAMGIQRAGREILRAQVHEGPESEQTGERGLWDPLDFPRVLPSPSARRPRDRPCRSSYGQGHHPPPWASRPAIEYGAAAEDPLQDEQPLLAACAPDSLQYRIVAGLPSVRHPSPLRGRSRSTCRNFHAFPSGIAALIDRSPAAAQGNLAKFGNFSRPRPALLLPPAWIEHRG